MSLFESLSWLTFTVSSHGLSILSLVIHENELESRWWTWNPSLISFFLWFFKKQDILHCSKFNFKPYQYFLKHDLLQDICSLHIFNFFSYKPWVYPEKQQFCLSKKKWPLSRSCRSFQILQMSWRNRHAWRLSGSIRME